MPAGLLQIPPPAGSHFIHLSGSATSRIPVLCLLAVLYWQAGSQSRLMHLNCVCPLGLSPVACSRRR